MAGTVTIVQVRSPNGSSAKQLATLQSLGLGRIGRTSEKADGDVVRGQLRSVAHLVEVRP
jgi:large subunit ribosomal protein L30